jgi:hypothetical protein
LERRRAALSEIEAALRSATAREQITEQLRRISEELKFVDQLCGRSSSLQTAAAILNLTRENSRLSDLATRRLAGLEQKSGTAFPLGACRPRRPAPPAA